MLPLPKKTVQYPSPIWHSILGIFVAFTFGGVASAEPLVSTLDAKKKPHLRVGVSFRQVSVDFSRNSSPPAPFGLTSGLPSGLGDVGLFTATSGNITYDNGVVGPDPGPVFPSGEAFATIANVSQLTPTVPPRTELNSPVLNLAYQTSETTYANNLQGSGLLISDDESTAAPFIQLVFPIKEEEIGGKEHTGNRDYFLNAVVGYTFLKTAQGHALQPVGSQQIASTTTNYTYVYDYIDIGGPVVSPGALPGTTIYDVAAAVAASGGDISGNELLDPRTSATTTTGLISLLAVSQTNLDLELHEIPFGLEWGRTYGKTKIALNAGGTLNIVNLSLANRTDWFLAGTPGPVFSRYSRQSDTAVKLGAYLGMNLTYPLNEEGTVYFEAHTSYRWVGSVHVETIDARADVDLSSWEGGVGIGILF